MFNTINLILIEKALPLSFWCTRFFLSVVYNKWRVIEHIVPPVKLLKSLFHL